MLSTAFMLLLGSSFLMLRLGAPGSSFPAPLGAEEERECVRRMLAGDMEARNRLIEHNLRLVAHIVKKYYTRGGDQEDLISIGTVGLIKGVSTYRPDKGVRLATYAARCVENEVLMYFRSLKKTAGEVSLSDPIDTDGDGNGLSFMDILAEDTDLLEEIAHGDACARLRSYVDTALSPREAEIIRLRYGLGGRVPRTQRETAEECGISRSYVSRIEKKALEKLRAVLEA